MIRVVAEGMRAYYNRDPEALRHLLESVEERQAKFVLRVANLEQIINSWPRAKEQESDGLPGAV